MTLGDVFVNSTIEFSTYVATLPDPIWIKLLALLGVIYLIYVARDLFVRVIILLVTSLSILIFVVNWIKERITRRLKNEKINQTLCSRK